MVVVVRCQRGGFFITINNTRFDYFRPKAWVPLSIRHRTHWWGTATLDRF